MKLWRTYKLTLFLNHESGRIESNDASECTGTVTIYILSALLAVYLMIDVEFPIPVVIG